MSNVLSLALKINADASGLKLDPVERALQRLGEETNKVTGIFQKFGDSSEAAARAQERTSESLNQLIAARRAGTVTAQEFASQFQAIADGANKEAAALERAARITEANLSPIQRYEQAARELNEQLAAGRITLETYERELEKIGSTLKGTSKAAEKTDKDIESLAKRLGLLTAIEVGRVIVDGIQAIGSVISSTFSQVSSFVASVANSFDSFNDLSARTGIGVEALQGYSLAAQLAGVETEAFGAAVQRLGVSIGKATPGDALDKSLKAINLSVTELRGLSPESQFSEIGEAISALPTAADRAAAAVAVFGQQGAALAPLFREGAESIEDLRARADRLGIIVDETQLNNIGAMNDAFDLARKTVEGIAGQVIGNLAPAVTAVVDQFLQFIEAFEGADGAGGSAIADKISRVLLDAADYFAVKFDQLAEYFSGFSVTLEAAGTVFATVADILTVVVESFRTVFNLLQVGVGAITEGLGRVLEGIGSWVSSDLEAFGQGLADAAAEQNRQNIAEMEDAASKAADAFNRALDGSSGSTTSAGQGAASRFMQGVRSQFEQERSPEFQVESNIDDTAERLTRFLADAGDGADKLFVQSSETLKIFQQQAAAGELTADQIAIMNGFMENLNGQLDVELAKRKEISDAAAKQAEADSKRVAELLKTSNAASKVLDDLSAVEREIARIQETAARPGVDSDGVASAQSQLAELEKLRDTLDQQLEASSLGFAEGFEKAFSATGANFATLSKQALEFGKSGFDAATRLQEGILRAQEQARDGILNRESYEREVAREQELFQQKLQNLEKERAARQEATRQAFQGQVDANARVQEFLNAQFGQQAQAAQAEAERRLVAAQNIVAIEQQLALEQQRLAAARQQGDLEAARNAVARIAQLDQVAAKERDIASGRAKAEAAIQEKRQKSLEAEQQAAQQAAQQRQKLFEQQQQQAKQVAEQQRKAFEERAKAQQAEFNRQAEIARQLNSVGQQSIAGGDIRSSQGAQAFLRTAANAFDPRAAEQLRLQREQLKLMRALAERLVPEALGYLQQGVTTTVSFLGNTP